MGGGLGGDQRVWMLVGYHPDTCQFIHSSIDLFIWWFVGLLGVVRTWNLQIINIKYGGKACHAKQEDGRNAQEVLLINS